MTHGFFRELKRRHVYRVAVAYAVVGWLLIEVTSTIVPALHLPAVMTTIVVVVVLLGFPIAVLLTWAFEMTPEGVRRTEPADSPEARAPDQHRNVGHTLDRVIIGVLVIAVALLAWRQWSPRPPAAATTPSTTKAALSHATPPASATSIPHAPAAASTAIPAKSIAVLPFENLSTDKANGYFADGMQDLILTKLADIGELKVISRTSTMVYGSHPQNLKKVGRELGVATLLEGSVQKVGDQVLVNVQLIDAQTDAHIWADSYQRTLKNVFGVEGEVADKIADALKAKLSPAETRRLATALSDDPQANILYLQAQDSVRHSYATSIPRDDLLKAIELYRQAITRVPDFALARAGLSYAESYTAFLGFEPGQAKSLVDDARRQAEQALKLAPDLPEAHLALGYSDYYGRGDYDAALKAFAVALHLRPNDASVYAARGYVLRRQGHFHAAIDALQRSLTLDPRSETVAWNLAQTYMAIGRYTKAGHVVQQGLALDPGNFDLRVSRLRVLWLRTGDPKPVLAMLTGKDPSSEYIRSFLLTLDRRYAEAIALTRRAKVVPAGALGFTEETKTLQLALIHQLSGDMAQSRRDYAKALPMIRARLAAKTNDPANAALTWVDLAQAELALGQAQRGTDAIHHALAAIDASGDHFVLPNILLQTAQTYARAHRPQDAVPMLARALATPGIDLYFSPPMLWTDPSWDPIRHTPGFQALLKKYASSKPASVPGEAGSD